MPNAIMHSPVIVKTNDSIIYFFYIVYPMAKNKDAAKIPEKNNPKDNSVFPIPNIGAAFPKTVIVMIEWQIL